MDYTVHGILQARTLEWVAFPFSRGSSQPGDQTQVSCIAGTFFTSWACKYNKLIHWFYGEACFIFWLQDTISVQWAHFIPSILQQRENWQS